jgi:hypothetical protein
MVKTLLALMRKTYRESYRNYRRTSRTLNKLRAAKLSNANVRPTIVFGDIVIPGTVAEPIGTYERLLQIAVQASLNCMKTAKNGRRTCIDV